MDHQPEIYQNRLSQSKPSCGNLLDPCPSTLVVWQSSFHPYHQTWTRHCHGGWSKIRPCEKIVRLLAWVDPTRKKKKNTEKTDEKMKMPMKNRWANRLTKTTSSLRKSPPALLTSLHQGDHPTFWLSKSTQHIWRPKRCPKISGNPKSSSGGYPLVN